MDDLRLHAVAARVVAWHNRHPLARRITAAQVHSVGYVALPYSAAAAVEPALEGTVTTTAEPPPEAAAGSSLRERALARAKHQDDAALPVLETAVTLPATPPRPRGLKAAFVEDFIAPLSPRRVARWALRHGRALVQAPADAPLREVIALPLQAGRRPLTLFVLTAAIEVGKSRRRVLLGGGETAPVLGPRVWSPMRAGTLGAGVCALALAIRLGVPMAAPDVPMLALATAPHAAASQPPSHEPATPPADPAASAPHGEAVHAEAAVPAPHAEAAASSHTAAAHGAEGPQLHVAALTEAPAAPAHDAAAADPQTTAPSLTTPPIDVEPRLGRIALPKLDMPARDAAKAASQQLRDQRAAALAAAAPASAATAPRAPTSPPVATQTAAAAATPEIPRGAPAFAVSTRLLRTRAEAEQLAAAMGVLLQGKDGVELRVDVLPQGDDWRVVGWPFAAAAQADKARALLAARGMRVAVVDF